MDKVYEETLLFDYYGELLTERQRAVCRLHLAEDWSLAEIAEELSVSRQAVHDTLKKAFAALNEYENKLHMVERNLAVSAELGHLSALAEEGRLEEGLSRLHELIRIE